MTPMRSAGAASSASAARVSASDQRVVVRPLPPGVRTSGSPRRSGWLTTEKSKRPLSQSQPQLTGSTSTPE